MVLQNKAVSLQYQNITITFKLYIMIGTSTKTKARFEEGKIIFGAMDDVIHINHGIPMSKEELKEDVYSPFIVFQGISNFCRNHGVMAATDTEALELVAEYLTEKEGYDMEYVSMAVIPIEF